MILILGSFRFHNKSSLKISDLLITLVQPNIEQKNKWNLKIRDRNLKKLEILSNINLQELNDKNRLIIWPETSFEGSIPNEKKFIKDLGKKIIKSPKTTLIMGLLRTDENKIFNSLVFLNSQGQILYHYDKTKLVPFGEYIPFREHLRLIFDILPPTDFSSGKQEANPNIDGFGELITLICYEILFSDEIFKRISKNTNLLINITNDAWFGKTIGPYQHLALAKIKAVEFGLPLARVANTGISVYVSPYGEIIGQILLSNEGVKTFNLTTALDPTLYRIYGEYIFIVSIFILLVINKFYKQSYKEIESNEK